MQLRQYQLDAIDAIYDHLRTETDNPCVVLPTGAGKSLLLAQICKDVVTRWNGRVIILAHVKELLVQSATHIEAMSPDLEGKVGVYSAGLNRRDTDTPILVAGIQSVYKRAFELGAFNLIIVDEAHMIPPDGEGRYRTFLESAIQVNPRARVIGLTATPYRMKSGYICQPENFLNKICFEVDIKPLIDDGFLCKLRSKGSDVEVSTDGLHKRGGEFIDEEVQTLFDTPDKVQAACKEVIELTTDRKSVLIFASGVDHGWHIHDELIKQGVPESDVAAVFGDTLPFERHKMIEKFKSGELKYLVNMGVLTMGFDAPNVDCVVLLRCTASPGLYYQIVGRGFRVCEGKDDCLVLDFGTNIIRLGPVDSILVTESGNGVAPLKKCPECQAIIPLGYRVCPECEHVFEVEDDPELKHEAKASDEAILSNAAPKFFVEYYDVLNVRYSVHTKRNADESAPKTLRVDYETGYHQDQSEWVCIEHQGYSGEKARLWWSQRSRDPFPTSAAIAVWVAEHGGVALTKRIKVKTPVARGFSEILSHFIEDKPEPVSRCLDCNELYTGLPFCSCGCDDWTPRELFLAEQQQPAPLNMEEVPF